jgi:hypothetical protein
VTENDRIDEIVGRMREARDRGEPVDPEQVVRLHPEIADPLRARLAVLHLVDQAYADAESPNEDEAAAGVARLAGARLGDYRLEDAIGTGGMGTVYVARRSGDDASERVAVKVIHSHLLSRPEFRERFRREAEAGIQLRHPNIVRTLDVGAATHSGSPVHYLVMELVEGETMRAMLTRLARIPDALLRALALQIAQGLAAMHAAGIVHRDLKPENVIVTPDQRVQIMDLGIARVIEAARTLTGTGDFTGSVLYAAPEQFQAAKADARADLYALGVLLYEMATARNPFERESTPAIMRAHVEQRPEPLRARAPRISPFLSDLTGVLLAKAPKDRIASADTLVGILRDGEAGEWWRERETEAHDRDGLEGDVLPETPLIGREEPLAVLGALFASAADERGQLALVRGEPGVGKSHLLAEFARGLAGHEARPRIVIHSCTSSRSALVPRLVSLLDPEDHAAIPERYPESERPRIADWLRTIRTSERALRGESWPEVVYALMETVIDRLSEARPLVLIIEDLHDADPRLLAFFEQVAQATTLRRMLLVGSYRPGRTDRWCSGCAWFERARRIHLDRLGARNVSQLLEHWLGSGTLAREVGYDVLTATDGNPLFVLETLRSLEEEGRIVRRENGAFESPGEVGPIRVPVTVAQLMSKRLAQLDLEDRTLLEAAACAGPDFNPIELAKATSRSRLDALQRLARLEIEWGLVRPNGRAYRFDHHLVREVLLGELREPLRLEIERALDAARTNDAERPRTRGHEAHGGLRFGEHDDLELGGVTRSGRELPRFFEWFLGNWKMKSVAGLPGRGRATVRASSGNAFVFEDMELISDLQPGVRMTTHGVWMPSGDGKRVGCWFFAPIDDEPMVLAGAIDDLTLEVYGESKEGRRHTVTSFLDRDHIRSRTWIEDRLALEFAVERER